MNRPADLVSALLSDRTAMIKRLMKFEVLQAEVVAAEGQLAIDTAECEREHGASRAQLVKLFGAVAERRTEIEAKEADLEGMLANLASSEAAWQGLGLPSDIAIRLDAGADHEAIRHDA